jgi:serine/threonine-protein kinase
VSPTPHLEGWELVACLGEGALTRVYQARPRVSPADAPADYAIKLLRPELRTQPYARRLLEREAQAAAQVAHPNLISVLASEVPADEPHLVLPYLPGTTLGRVLRCGLRPTLAQSLWYIRQTADALAAFHRAGWLHGDVKPDNILVSVQGHVTLLDLGFAARIGAVDGSQDAVQPLVMSPAYAAPERLVSRTSATAAADIYSLGAALFELLAGCPPFVAPSSAALARLHLEAAPPDLALLLPELPSGVVRLVRRMLAKEPLRRPDSGELSALLMDLELAAFERRMVQVA